MLHRRHGRLVAIAISTIVCVLLVVSLSGNPAVNPSRDLVAQVTADVGAPVGNGVVDDTAALQRLVASSKGNVVLAPGRYRITKTIEIRLAEHGPLSISGSGTATIIMGGAGPAIRIVGTHGGTASPKTVKPEVWNERTPCLDGIEIEGAHPEANGIELTGTMQPILTRITVRNARHGLVLTNRNRNVVIDNCHLYDNRGVGILFDKLNLHQVNITNCHISYNDQGGIVIRESEIRNLQIGSCDIEGNMAADQKPTANILIDTTVGSVREIAIVGCTLQHNHTSPGSANIRCIGRSREEAQKIGHMTIGDNVMSDVAVNVHLQNVRGVTMTGNTFWKGFEQNLLVEGSSNIVVGPNLFDRNPDYRPADSANGILFRDCQDCSLTGLHINNALSKPAALVLEDCSWCRVSDCSVLDCPSGGILLYNCVECEAVDNLIRHDGKRSAPVILDR
jgi:hypothetical protein